MTIICEIFFCCSFESRLEFVETAYYLRVCNRDIVGIEPERLTDQRCALSPCWVDLDEWSHLVHFLPPVLILILNNALARNKVTSQNNITNFIEILIEKQASTFITHLNLKGEASDSKTFGFITKESLLGLAP
jgi:hypothetical protein